MRFGWAPDDPLDAKYELWVETDRDPAATPWIAPTFQNSWTNYGTGFNLAGYRKIGDIVYLRGLVKGGASGATIFTLPAGFRPAYTHIVPCRASDAMGETRMHAGGEVQPQTGLVSTWWCLDGSTFG